MHSPIKVSCPICSYSLAIPFFNPGPQPLATLGWPRTAAEARDMKKLKLDFVQCPSCSHVWNRAFEEEQIPYQVHPNRMFNKGSKWGAYLAKSRDMLIAELPANPVIVDIGCGDGHFIHGLSEALGGHGKFVGFDPNLGNHLANNIEFYPRYFNPLIDMATLNPDLILLRHVIEHMECPLQFIEQLAWGAQDLPRPCLLFVEVPCIDRVFETARLADFFYEHVSHFTTDSFRHLLTRAGNIRYLRHGYGREVIYALIEVLTPEDIPSQAKKSAEFNRKVQPAVMEIKRQLGELKRNGHNVAIWGGTGKAAAFMQYFCISERDFSLVVDSDKTKIGTFVPGLGQEIKSPTNLKNLGLHTVIIPSQWRAKDIIKEMEGLGVFPEQILIEHGGRLIDFKSSSHPYG